jgi:hypothetical protein
MNGWSTCCLIAASSRTTFSIGLRLYPPKILEAAQNSQSRGQPREVWMGMRLYVQEVVARDARLPEVDVAKGAVSVDALQRALPPILEDTRPQQLPFPGDDGIGVLGRLVRQEAAVQPTQDHGRALGAVEIRDRVHDVRLRGEGADGHDVEGIPGKGGGIELRALEIGDVVAVRRRGRQCQRAERRHAGDHARALHETGKGDAEADQAFVVDANPADGEESHSGDRHRWPP